MHKFGIPKIDEAYEKYKEEELATRTRTLNDYFELKHQVKKMQATLKSGGKCDGLCGMCLLFDEGCLIHYTLKGFKKDKK